MDVATHLGRLRGRGVEVRLEGDSLKVCGRIAPEDDKFFREHKPAIVQHLRDEGADCFQQMRNLSQYFGRDVVVDGRTVKLWGLTPRGAIVDTGLFVIAVDFDAVSPPRSP